jgi:hypothetical protein
MASTTEFGVQGFPTAPDLGAFPVSVSKRKVCKRSNLLDQGVFRLSH